MTDAARAERPKLSTELAEYLVSLSVALQRHAMYPGGHPSLAPAIDGVLRRAHRLLEDRPSLAFGVARRQLIVEGVTTDPEHPVLRRLAEELHRHHLGAVSVNRGVQPDELSAALRALAAEPERAGGLLPEWPHVRLHPLAFDGLALVGDAPLSQGGRARARARCRRNCGWVLPVRPFPPTPPQDPKTSPSIPRRSPSRSTSIRGPKPTTRSSWVT